jgi:diguanylate cyclase (GGDEF)-like protein
LLLDPDHDPSRAGEDNRGTTRSYAVETRHAPATRSFQDRFFLTALVGGCCAIIVIVAWIAFRWSSENHDQHRALALTRARNVVQLLSRHVANVVEKADLVLKLAAFEYRRDVDKAQAGMQAIGERIADGRMSLPEVNTIRIATADGVVRFGTDGVTGVSVADRAYFQAARAGARGLLFSEPLKGRILNEWVVVLARRLEDPRGRFAGVVLAAIPSSYWEKVFQSLDLGNHGAISMRSADLRLIARHPGLPAPGTTVGSTNVSVQLREAILASRAGGSYVAATALDGIERINAYERVANTPYYVIVGVSSEQWRSEVREDDIGIASLAGLAIAVTLGLSWLLYLSWRRQREAHLKLAAQSRELAGFNEMLHELSIRDPLTGTFNRRYLDETLPRDLSRARRDRQPVSLIMIDLDHFKDLNDARGHPAGDAALAAVGAVLKSAIREGDIACRYGGEEFLLVLQNLSLAMALERAEDIRDTIASLEIDIGNRAAVRITVSAGVAAFPENGDGPEELVRCADAALYQAKSAGRNCVRSAAPKAIPSASREPAPYAGPTNPM